MSLSGHLSDLSLSELIEFFCNQRKTGRLKVTYPQGPGYFFLQLGSVVDAKIGVLRGIDAVYYALTLPNAAFEFRGGSQTTERTINQPWTQVVLEGLRRLDEGLTPPEAFPEGSNGQNKDGPSVPEGHVTVALSKHDSRVPAFLSMVGRASMSQRKPIIAGAVAIAVLLSVAVIGVPAGWYHRVKPATVSTPPVSAPSPASQPAEANSPVAASEQGSPKSDTSSTDAGALVAKRQREWQKARARAAKAAASDQAAKAAASSAPGATTDVTSKSAPKKATVQVTYDESGRVTQATGADPTALRIARQKRFPPGKAGTASITIPIN
jgi:hypothetical protein